MFNGTGQSYLVAFFSILSLSGCGGSGGGAPNDPQNDGTPNVVDIPIGAQTNSIDMIALRGRPSIFSLECSRHVFDATSGNWVPQENYLRLETWIYSNAEGSEVVSIVNGEIISRSQTTANYSDYPNPNIDPRLFGCGEPIETVERVLDATRFSSTNGTEVEAELNLGGGQIEYTYYTVNGSTTGIRTTYISDTLIGMVTL